MLPLIISELARQGHSFNFLDIGSSGSLDSRWEPLYRNIMLFGFDPNASDCDVQNKEHPYKKATFLPYAVYSHDTTLPLYETMSPYCTSTLEPNLDWLDRFEFKDLFRVVDTRSIHVKGISNIKELENFSPDIIKIDVQGAELPILRNATSLIRSSFYMELESGFNANYIGESLFADIDHFMRGQDFLLFDINTSHRISRDNPLKSKKTGKEQLLWAESIWLKDLIQIERENRFNMLNIDRTKALKTIVLCAFQGCFDFGYELAHLFNHKGLVSDFELRRLKKHEAWTLP